jgi:hypothetical protein
MTIGSDNDRAPSQGGSYNGDGYDSCAEEHPWDPRPINEMDLGSADRALRDDEQQPNLAGLIQEVLAAWPTTFRFVVLLVVLGLLVGGLLWFVPVEVVAGPVTIRPR